MAAVKTKITYIKKEYRPEPWGPSTHDLTPEPQGPSTHDLGPEPWGPFTHDLVSCFWEART